MAIGVLVAFGVATYAGLALLGLPPLTATLLGAVIALGLGLGWLILAMQHGAAVTQRQLSQLASSLQLGERRQHDAETKLALLIEHARRQVDEPRAASAIDVEATGTLLRELAEVVSGQEAVVSILAQRLAQLEDVGSAPAPAVAAPRSGFAPEVPRAAPRPAAVVAPPPEAPFRAERLAEPALPQSAPMPASNLRLIKDAITKDAFELFLQPIVSLPQRKTRAYEATLRPLQSGDNAVSAADLRNAALTTGLAARLDRAAISRSIDLVRVFRQRGRDATVLATLTPAGLADAEVSASLRRLIAEEPESAGSLVLMLPQASLRNLGPIEAATLDEIARGGMRIGICEATDLRFNAEELAARGVRFVKAAASRLIEAGQAAPGEHLEIHAADLGGFLARHGISLIADGIAAEQTVLDLLDFVVPLAEGDLFSTPRQVRPEVLGQAATPAVAVPETEAAPRTSFRSLLRRAAV